MFPKVILKTLPANAKVALPMLLDPSGKATQYDTFAIAQRFDDTDWSTVADAVPVDASIMNRIFGPLSKTTEPDAGGLGVWGPDFVREATKLPASQGRCGWNP